ncbi:MAG: hypothetical protein JO340_04060 [Acidobacteriaceae bacterium]|nr:hypothetical protein [Acidobacteriaceae bacterium]
MRRLLPSLFAAAALSSFIFAASDATEARSDPQLRAMLDELAHSKDLKLNDLDRPYFIAYSVSDVAQYYIAASLGGVTASTRYHVRQPRLEVRVGDYKFDNTNSIYSGGEHLTLFPLDDDYQAMRAELWLGTDGLYKAAAEQIAHKRAALREMADPDKTPDFVPVNPIQLLRPIPALDFDQPHWEQLLRQLSSRFAAHPEIAASQLSAQVISSAYRLVTSEGTVLRIPQGLSEIGIHASALAPDGARVWDQRFITTLAPSQFPSADQLAKAVDAVASETGALAHAPLADEYSGPVLFEQEAAAQMMAQVLTDAIRIERRPIAPPGSNQRGSQPLESVWSARMGAKVAPDWLTIYDDPLQSQFQGVSLAGHYEADDQGVSAARVNIVENGALKNFLFSRQPVRAFNASNGHGRLPGAYGAEQAVIGNLFVESSQPIPESRLKTELLEKIKAAGLPFGLLIRRLDFPSTANFQELQNMARQLQKSGYSRTLNAPLLAYRVYPDGREVLVRGLRFKEFSAKDLRDIDAASARPYVFNYVNNGSSFDLAAMAADATTSTVVCPSLLFPSLDLGPIEDEASRLPIVPAPALNAP